MKKLLLASVAVSGLAFAAPAHASEFDLTVGGYFKGYGAFVNQDTANNADTASVDILRDTEIHIGLETTLDNGLTVGAWIELEADATDGATTANESYAYFSGDWGRVNFGYEDGAAYLLQVAAPSADSNIDGIRQYIQPFVTSGNMDGVRLDYDMVTGNGKNDKLSYLSPIISGFQFGASFTPDSTGAAGDLGGVFNDTDTTLADTANVINETYEIAARYEGQVQNVGVIVGAGYSHGSQENTDTAIDNRKAWNIGLDLDIGPFGVGASYSEDNNAEDGTGVNAGDNEIFVVGVDYTTGAFKLGASYYNNDDKSTNGVEYDRYTAGVTYEYGPGMTFRGSIQQLDVDNVIGTNSANGTAVLLGTQVNF